jgi:uncharacterized membrane protein
MTLATEPRSAVLLVETDAARTRSFEQSMGISHDARHRGSHYLRRFQTRHATFQVRESAYLGAVYKGVGGALVAPTAVSLDPASFFFGMVPFWARLRHTPTFKAIFKGVNATAIGLVGAACVMGKGITSRKMTNASHAL